MKPFAEYAFSLTIWAFAILGVFIAILFLPVRLSENRYHVGDIVSLVHPVDAYWPAGSRFRVVGPLTECGEKDAPGGSLFATPIDEEDRAPHPGRMVWLKNADIKIEATSSRSLARSWWRERDFDWRVDSFSPSWLVKKHRGVIYTAKNDFYFVSGWDELDQRDQNRLIKLHTGDSRVIHAQQACRKEWQTSARQFISTIKKRPSAD